MKITGIDLAYRNIGICRVNFDYAVKPTSFDSWQTIKNPKPTSLQMYIDTFDNVIRTLDPIIVRSSLVIIEVPYGSQNAVSAKMIGFCIALVSHISLKHRGKIIPIRPQQTKAWAGGQTKHDVKKKVLQIKREIGDKSNIITEGNDHIWDAAGAVFSSMDLIKKCWDNKLQVFQYG